MEYKLWKKAHLKYECEIRHKNVLQECKHFKIIPKFIKIGNKTLKKEFYVDTIKFERLILNKITRRKFAKITYFKEQVKRLKEKVKNVFTEEKIKEYSNKLKRIAAYEKERHEQAQSRKLNTTSMLPQ